MLIYLYTFFCIMYLHPLGFLICLFSTKEDLGYVLQLLIDRADECPKHSYCIILCYFLENPK